MFVIYDEEQAVVNLLRQCVKVQGNFFLLFADAKTPKLVSVNVLRALFSPGLKAELAGKVLRFQAQVRPWFLESIAYTPRPDLEVNTRLTVFIGGVPRPIAARRSLQRDPTLVEMPKSHFSRRTRLASGRELWRGGVL